jgi:hypothetical protein
MPRIELRDASGYYHRIDSSDSEIIMKWLLEHAKQIVSANTNYQYNTLSVYPLMDDNGNWDWPANLGSHYGITQEKMHALYDWLKLYVDVNL